MKFIESVIDSAENIADDANNAEEAMRFLSVFAAQQITAWAADRDENGYTANNAKSLVSAAGAFLGLAALSGLDLDSALRELCLQAEEALGGIYLDGFERDAAHMARDNEERIASATIVREHLAAMFGAPPVFSRVR